MQSNKQSIFLATAFCLLFLLIAAIREFMDGDAFTATLLLLGLFAAMVAVYFGLNQTKKLEMPSASFMDANLEALMENDKDAIWCVDENFRLISFNKVFKHLFKGFWQREPKIGVSILFPENKRAFYKLWNSW